MIKWIKKLIRIVSDYDAVRNDHHNQLMWLIASVKEAKELIRNRTEIDGDIHLTGHDCNQIIITGRYRNRDYVEVFTVNDNDLEGLILRLKDMQKYGVVCRMDAAQGFRAIIDRKLTY